MNLLMCIYSECTCADVLIIMQFCITLMFLDSPKCRPQKFLKRFGVRNGVGTLRQNGINDVLHRCTLDAQANIQMRQPGHSVHITEVSYV